MQNIPPAILARDIREIAQATCPETLEILDADGYKKFSRIIISRGLDGKRIVRVFCQRLKLSPTDNLYKFVEDEKPVEVRL